VSAGWFSTRIEFPDDTLDLDESTVLAAASYHRTPRLGFEAAAGAVLDGAIDGRDVEAGYAASLGLSWLALLEQERRPFGLLSVTLAGSRTRASGDDGRSHVLGAIDTRIGAVVGKTFGPATVYLAGRAFAGPVGWSIGGKSVTGSDAHHYTAGVGASLRLGRRLELGGEGMPVGEQSATLSASVGL
jgi:hypothetical protein